MNKVILIGNVGTDPNVRYLDSGVCVAQIRLATTERGYTLQNGTQVPERTEWHNVIFWRKLAEIVEKHVHKGDKILVDGKIQSRNYTDQQGMSHHITEIMAENMEILVRKNDSPRRDDYYNGTQNQQPYLDSMLYYDTQFQQGTRIAIWHVTEDLDELFYLLPDDVSVREEANRRFKSQKRILEWVAVRVLLYDMLDRQVDIFYDDDGAPHLPDYEKMDISISHTKDYVAVALATEGEIGIDIEQIADRVEKVRERFVREDEQAQNINQLLLHWSAKETAFKMLHRRKVDFLKHFKVLPFKEEQEGTFQLQEFKTDDEQVLNVNYKIFPDFVLTYSTYMED